MKFPTIEEMAQNIAENALDEWEYNGKTLRQWIEIILATDINVATKDGTDCISRQAAIDELIKMLSDCFYADEEVIDAVETTLKELPPAQPEIIRCKDCKLNPKYEWFGCPMSHLSEKQRPETSWCCKAERRTDERSD